MSKNEKFDFSREEDQKRFEQLPKEEKSKEIASAQQQFNFMLQKVQSGEVKDYDEAEEKYEEEKNNQIKKILRSNIIFGNSHFLDKFEKFLNEKVNELNELGYGEEQIKQIFLKNLKNAIMDRGEFNQIMNMFKVLDNKYSIKKEVQDYFNQDEKFLIKYYDSIYYLFIKITKELFYKLNNQRFDFQTSKGYEPDIKNCELEFNDLKEKIVFLTDELGFDFSKKFDEKEKNEENEYYNLPRERIINNKKIIKNMLYELIYSRVFNLSHIINYTDTDIDLKKFYDNSLKYSIELAELLNVSFEDNDFKYRIPLAENVSFQNDIKIRNFKNEKLIIEFIIMADKCGLNVNFLDNSDLPIRTDNLIDRGMDIFDVYIIAKKYDNNFIMSEVKEKAKDKLLKYFFENYCSNNLNKVFQIKTFFNENEIPEIYTQNDFKRNNLEFDFDKEYLKFEEIVIAVVQKKIDIGDIFEAQNIINFAKKNNIELDFSTPEIQQILQKKYPQGIKVEDLLELSQIPEVGIKLTESLYYLTNFSFKNHIQPIINSQGVGAYLYFESIKEMKHKNLSNEDIEYITLVAKKYGTKARNILENILVKIGSQKISQEKENIENFIQEIKIIDFNLFTEYQKIKNNPEKKKELKENVNILQNKVYKGETTEEDFKNNLYSAVSYHTFPPAIGITKDQYEQLNETRPDRRNDVSESLDDLQYQKFQIPTGKYTIGENEELNLEKWQTIGNAIKKVNAEMEKETKAEINEIEVGQKLIEMYQKKTTEEKSNQEFLFENMYRYHLQKGGGKLESGFQISIQGLMQYKEFVGDRIKNDLIKDMLTKWKEQNSKEFEKLKADTMNRLKASQAQNFSKVKNMLNAIQKQTDETKKQKAIENLDEFLKHFQMSYDQIKGKNIDELARHIEATKVDYEGELTEENYQTEEYYNSDSFIKAYDEFTEKKDQDKLVFQKISSDLIAETNKKMRKEVDKFKFETDEGGSETKELEFAISKKKEHGVVGYNTGVCVAPDEQLWNDETFSNCIMFDPELKQSMGGMHFLIRENNLCLPGINPSLEILSQVENEKLFDQMMEYAKKVKDKLNLEKVLIPIYNGF